MKTTLLALGLAMGSIPLTANAQPNHINKIEAQEVTYNSGGTTLKGYEGIFQDNILSFPVYLS